LMTGEMDYKINSLMLSLDANKNKTGQLFSLRQKEIKLLIEDGL
jgi:hypothetical protein